MALVEAPAGLRLTIGHTLPAGLDVEAVTLDGAPAAYEVVETIRGREVRVETSTEMVHMLAVTAGGERVYLSAEHTTLVGTVAGDTLHIPARSDKQPLEHTSTAEAPHTPFEQHQPSRSLLCQVQGGLARYQCRLERSARDVLAHVYNGPSDNT
jgi:hypothetical protein